MDNKNLEILNSDCKGESDIYKQDNDYVYFVKPEHISLLEEDAKVSL